MTFFILLYVIIFLVKVFYHSAITGFFPPEVYSAITGFFPPDSIGVVNDVTTNNNANNPNVDTNFFII
ncbi:MAG: hypothetical protein DCF13_04670 [Flavobacteriaceae bacterium]|nr:MAG: hypothetical protein DCF13_04670 [Flavobacteriaceae bacterium]